MKTVVTLVIGVVLGFGACLYYNDTVHQTANTVNQKVDQVQKKASAVKNSWDKP
jgi:hypothetical protein